MTIKQALQKNYTSQKLRIDLELILAFVLKKPREFVLAHPEQQLTKNQTIKFNNLWKKRIRHYPLAYLTGQKEFYGLDFQVGKKVLIPRPETEYLAERVITVAGAADLKKRIIADVGTGSGCIAITLKKYLPLARIIGLDTSVGALTLAKKNARRLRVKVDFYRGGVSLLTNKKIAPQIIVANLPYLDKTKKQYYYTRCPELRHEPGAALFAGQGGLKDYIDLLKEIMLFDVKPHLLFLELGLRQLKAAKIMVKKICSQEYSITATNYGGTAIIELQLKA